MIRSPFFSARFRPARLAALACSGLAMASCATAALGNAPPTFADLGGAAASSASAPLSAAAAARMVPIPGGSYPIGRDGRAADQRPAHRVTLEPFRIDRTEVTNAAFAEYLNALALPLDADFGVGEFRRASGPARTFALLTELGRGEGHYPIIALDDEQARIVGRNGRFQAAPGYENHPVAETTWAGARAYCRWRGADLPSEAQWEAAARGQDDRLFPWGNEAPDDRRAFVSRRPGVTDAVGQRPAGASPFGLLDMSGSMAEWTSSLYRPYPYRPDDGREDPGAEGERVTRGGDYIYDAEGPRMTVSHRNGFSNAPDRGHRHIGLRCASS